MKNVFIILSSIILSVCFTACEEELEIWDSATYEYSGRWHFKAMSENGQILKEYGSHTIQTYNSADDVSDELWIYDVNNVFAAKEDSEGERTGNIGGIKIKAQLEGDYSNFYSVDNSEEGAGLNASGFPVPGIAPGEADENVPAEDDVNVIPGFFNKGTVLEGKILKGAGTSKSGSQVDSIYLRLKLFAGEIVYNSVYDAENESYVWDSGEFSYYAQPDSVVIISGTRYTGFEEDEY